MLGFCPLIKLVTPLNKIGHPLLDPPPERKEFCPLYLAPRYNQGSRPGVIFFSPVLRQILPEIFLQYSPDQIGTARQGNADQRKAPQRKAMRSNMRQGTARHRKAMQGTAMQCNMTQGNARHRNQIQGNARKRI
jgi:hypothetical protein